MARWLVLTALVVAACSGETSGDGSGGADASSGGTSSGGASGASGSGGSSATGGSGGSGASGGSAGTGGSSGTAGSAASGGTGGAIADAGSCQEGGTLDAGTEAAIAAACTVAVVRVARIDEECSGAGGAHVTFDVIAVGKGPAVTRVNHGGHAYYAPPEGPDAVGEYFVAGIDPFGQLEPQPDIPGWCITGLPSVDGRVHTYLEASSEADAQAKMAAILGA